MSEAWYNEYWKDQENPEFVEFFTGWYGLAEDYPEDEDEYWVRRGFTLAGFNEGKRGCLKT